MLAALLGLYLLAIGFVWWCAEDERDLFGQSRRSRSGPSTVEAAGCPSSPRRAEARLRQVIAARLQERRVA